MERNDEFSRQMFEKWLTNPTTAQLRKAFHYVSIRLTNSDYDKDLNEINIMVENFLTSLSKIKRESHLTSSDLTLLFGVLSSLIVEIGQYRHEVAKINMSRAIKTRGYVAALIKDLFSHPILKKVEKDLMEEAAPLIDSCIERFYPYRVARICNVAERLYEISERTSDEKVKNLLMALYYLKYTRFGTSGVRGVWGKDITVKRVEAVVQAICDSIKSNEKFRGKTIVLGYDSRLHADIVAYWVARVLLANDFQVYMAERDTPTPVLSYFAIEKLKDDVAGVIVCTASHNPSEWHGVKYILHNGMQAPTSVTDWIGARANQLLVQNTPVKSIKDFEKAKSEGKLKIFDPLNEYCDWILSKPYDVGLKVEAIKDWLQDKLVVIDEMYGAGREYMRNILTKIGVPFVVVHGMKDPMFGNLQYANPEEPYVADCQYMVRKMGAVIGIAMDADADRFGAIDRDGIFFNANQIIAMFVMYLLRHREMEGKVIHSFTCFPFIDEVIKTLNSNEKLIRPDPSAIPSYVIHPFYVLSFGNRQQIAGAPAYVTMVGMKYLAEAMMMNRHYQVENNPKIRESMVIAGEESGGLTTKGHIPDKDGLWADMLLLEMISVYKKSLREIWNELTNRLQTELYSGRLDVDGTEEAKDKLVDFYIYNFSSMGIKIGGLECTYIGGIRNDFVELHLEDAKIKGRLIVRASGTEPICRIYTECTLETKRREIEADALKKFEEISLEEVRKAHNPWHLIDILLVTPPLTKIIPAVKEKFSQFAVNGNNVAYIVWEELQKKSKRLDTRRRIMAETWLPIIEGWKGSDTTQIPPLDEIKEYGALVFDLDGTLEDRDDAIERKVILVQELKHLLERGFKLAILTAKGLDGVNKLVQSLAEALQKSNYLDLMKQLYIYSDGGGRKFSIDDVGRIVEKLDYREVSRISHGETQVEIARSTIDKQRALKDLITSWNLRSNKIIYFGDEFYIGGDDMPVSLMSGITKIAINSLDKRWEVPSNVLYAGPGLEALRIFLNKWEHR